MVNKTVFSSEVNKILLFFKIVLDFDPSFLRLAKKTKQPSQNGIGMLLKMPLMTQLENFLFHKTGSKKTIHS